MNHMNTLIQKSDRSGPCFAVSNKKSLKLSCDLFVIVGNDLVKFPAGTRVAMPETLTPGADYAVFATAKSLVADAYLTAPAAGVVKIGGFHFAPGGNASGREGGGSVPQINPCSIWDLYWRPGCRDPRGMALVEEQFWADIYLCGIDGASRFGSTIADGTNHARIPTMFGGNGTLQYDGLNCFQAVQLATAAGKTLLTRGEFQLAALGVLEKSSAGARHEVTQLDAPRTSKWGIIQATGCRYIWGAFDLLQDFAKFDAQKHIGTDLVGGCWLDGSYAGSRCSSWLYAPWYSSSYIGARFRSDHLYLP